MGKYKAQPLEFSKTITVLSLASTSVAIVTEVFNDIDDTSLTSRIGTIVQGKMLFLGAGALGMSGTLKATSSIGWVIAGPVVIPIFGTCYCVCCLGALAATGAGAAGAAAANRDVNLAQWGDVR